MGIYYSDSDGMDNDVELKKATFGSRNLFAQSKRDNEVFFDTVAQVILEDVETGLDSPQAHSFFAARVSSLQRQSDIPLSHVDIEFNRDRGLSNAESAPAAQPARWHRKPIFFEREAQISAQNLTDTEAGKVNTGPSFPHT